MRVELHDVSKGKGAQALPSTSLSYETGRARLAVAETEQRPTVLGLIAAGRMRSDTGAVVLDGRRSLASLRRRVALVDAPDVSDPAPNVTVAGVTAEELMFAGRAAHPVAVRTWLRAAGFGDVARTPIADVEPLRRIALLLELTALRADVDGLVLVSPDRHGGDPRGWWALAESFAARGAAVLVIVGEAAATVLADTAVRAEDTVRAERDGAAATGATASEAEADPNGKQAKPGRPVKKAKQVKPVKKAKQGKQGKKAKPVKPGKKAKQGKPVKPVKKAKQGKPVKKAKQGKPAKQATPGAKPPVRPKPKKAPRAGRMTQSKGDER